MVQVATHDPLTSQVSDFPKGEAVAVSTLPTCDVCEHVFHVEPKRALFDGKTVGGPWANMCPTHFRDWGIGLGTGRGQRLVTPPLPAEPSVCPVHGIRHPKTEHWDCDFEPETER
jgi:hypothetical protein